MTSYKKELYSLPVDIVDNLVTYAKEKIKRRVILLL